MKRYEAIKVILGSLKDELVICSTGMICKEAFLSRDRPQNFYMLGSMGLASSIGLGLALNTKKKVIVLEGDGALLMNLGILPQVGDSSLKNLLHIILDNGIYGSTGGQPTISKEAVLGNIAIKAGYSKVRLVATLRGIEEAMKTLLKGEGPSFMQVKVEPDNIEGIGRVTLSPEEIRERFIKCIG